MKGSLVISIHDFSPKYHSELSDILMELNVIGIKKRSLLVVPNYEGSYPLHKHPATVERILIEKTDCNEVCLHGYDHSTSGLFGREFKGIDYWQASIKLKAGIVELRDEDITPVGFVPPFWKISPAAELAVKNAGFSFLAKNPAVKDLKNNEVYYSIPVWFWPYQKPLDYAFRLYDWFLANVWNRSNDLVRVEIHPQDVHESRPFDYALKLIGCLSQDRMLVSHQEYLTSKRLS